MNVGMFREGHVEADGFRIRYQEAGSGETLVCLHGAGGLRLSRAHELLAGHRRVIAFEAPGFGTSPANERTASMAELACTLAAATANLGLERYSLLGSSFGGKLALWWAVQLPERLESVVLSAPAAIRAGVRPRRPLLAEHLYAHPERHPPLEVLPAATLEQQEKLVGRLIGPEREPELEGRLSTVEMPVLALFGTEDRVIQPELGRIYKELLPNCHLVFIYDAGHALDADRPEAFAAVVADFLARREGFLVNDQSSVINP
jgi:pimeloyl-ACP methyl ester carboxylesterase